MAEIEASRRYVAASKALSHELQRAFGWALWRAAAVTVLIAFVAAVIGGFVGITDQIGPQNPPGAIAVATLLFTVYVVTHAVLLWSSLGGRLGSALDVIAWTDRENRAEWEAASPGSSVPRTPGQARRWLDSHPETDANRPQRLAASLMVGDTGAARDALTRYPVVTAFQRHQRAADDLAVDLIEGRSVSFAELDLVDRELEAADRQHAIACRALSKVVADVLSGGSWVAPLASTRPELTGVATDMGRRKAWLVLVVILVLTAAVILVLALAVWLVVLA